MVKRKVTLPSLIYAYKTKWYTVQEESSAKEAYSKWAVSNGNNLKHAKHKSYGKMITRGQLCWD